MGLRVNHPFGAPSYEAEKNVNDQEASSSTNREICDNLSRSIM